MANKRILIADHDEWVAPILALHLRNEYYSVEWVKDIETTWSRLMHDKPDLLIISANLPPADEITLEACRGLLETAKVPAVYIVGEQRRRRTREFLDLLEDEPVLDKPIAARRLLATVGEVLNTRRAVA